MSGIQNSAVLTAPVAIATDVVPDTILSVTIPKLLRAKIRIWLPFSIGATGGIRAQLTNSGTGVASAITTTIILVNNVAPSITTAVQTALATAFTNVLANAGNHWMIIEATLKNSAAGTAIINLQVAQNTSDALTLTLLTGASMEVLETN